MSPRVAWLAAVMAGCPLQAFAHGDRQPVDGANLGISTFTLDPWVLAPLTLGLVLYASGLRRLWSERVGAGVKPGQAAAFFAGWLVLGISLVWPLDALAEKSLTAHMSQHMLLMAAAPPLLLLGLPGATWLAAFSSRVARALLRPFRHGVLSNLWRTLTTPMLSMVLQTAVMWGWHLPVAMQAALHSEPLHIAMHLSFLTCGLLFWTGVMRSLREPATGAGAGLIALVGTMMQMGLLGALITFADDPRYPHYVAHATAAGLSALEDQQLAGLIMWVPSAIPYLAGGVALASAWLSRGERRARRARPGSL